MKYLLTLSISIFAFLSSFSQRQQDRHREYDSENFFRFGAKAGVNLNKIPDVAFKDGFTYNYVLGGFLQFNFSDRFGFQPEVNFAQGTEKQTDDITDVWDDMFRSGKQKNQKLNIIKVPLLVNMNLGMSKHVKLQLGPQFSTVLRQTPDSTGEIRLPRKKGEIGLLGGVWIQIPVVNFGVRYEHGLTNANALDGKKWKNRGFNVFFGFTI
jgi:hypothetical protein